ncbi:uncharacterized protein [Rutidosis leptorrhynchoides]|uniref:uncharacterized protein n=1 Tax=Rutidosis leptorrhynchoides TaxID=125765 RepID=UPI003A999010
MKPDILEVQPQELKFLFELKKQSSCSVQMNNKTNQHVAFKVKTTNPKKYCVRPNTGVIDPKSTCDFTVTMQAQKAAPPDMICRDKFLVQSTVVPEGTMEEDVTSHTFAKEDGKSVDEKRLKVILLPPPDSPESSPDNGTLNLVHNNEGREIKDENVQKDSSNDKVDEGLEVLKIEGARVDAKRKEESFKRTEPVTRNEEPVTRNEEPVAKNEEPVKTIEQPVKRIEEPVKKIEEPIKRSQEYIKRNEEIIQNDTEELLLAKEVEETKLKVKELESKLNEAKATIIRLSEEKRLATQEKHFIQGELDLLRSKRHRAQVGFPLLFVFMVALVSLYLGYLLHR